jgi:stage V sporulation protein R
MTLQITSRTDWSPSLIQQAWVEIEKIAKEEMDLGPNELYPNQFEIVSSEQMIDAYASIGLPVHYHHWSFGKDFMQTYKGYSEGRQNLAYELVINSSPCVNYLMEDNDMTMQTMVMAHAGVGHNAVFKNNICFKQWTNAGNIVDYMVFARDYVAKCEEIYGAEEVEKVLDAAHSLAAHGVDKYKRKHKQRVSEEQRIAAFIEEEEARQRSRDIIIEKTTILEAIRQEDKEEAAIYSDEEENILYYILKRSPTLPQWKREILRIVYKVNQYFYPQGQTKNLNEGFATFCHYYIMTRLEEKGIITSDAYLQFLQDHSGVIFQPTYEKRYYGGINPYALGFAIMQDIKRICENPTAEDKEWFPELIGKRWQDAVKEAAFEYRDDSFVAQYLSPKVMRDMRMFVVNLDFNEYIPAYVTEIHDEVGYKNIRTALARSFERINYVPQIVVNGADLDGDRVLKLTYKQHLDRDIDHEDAQEVVDYIEYLWGYPVELSVENGK